MMLNNVPIAEALIKYRDSGTIPLHVPGHKQGSIYKKLGIDLFNGNILSLDATEVPGIDNLHCPESSILEAQKLAAEAFKALQTYFLVNGTTCGIYSMIMAAANPGDKIIIPRDCHKSVIGAIIMGKLIPVYITPEVSEDFEISGGIKPEIVEKALIQHPDAKAVVITRPNYYGICSDIDSIAKIVHSYGKLLLVDEAHGAHFAFSRELPKTAISAGADIAVQSTHKTLPAMTGSSMLHIGSDRVDIDKLKFFLQLYQTTSPSHILLASLDMARYIMSKYGENLLSETIAFSEALRCHTDKIQGIKCLGRNMIGYCGIYDIDPTRLTINVKDLGINGTKAEAILREKFKLQVEMSDLYNIVAVMTVGDDKEVYDNLAEALGKLPLECCYGKDSTIKGFDNISADYDMALTPGEALYAEKERVDFSRSVGLISAEMVVPYPPGIPVIMPGEIIKKEIFDYVMQCKDSGIKINGPSDPLLNTIKVIKKGE